jgi:hypothetical protein
MTTIAMPTMAAVCLDTVDWHRMAEPQLDQYDTDVTLAAATTSGSPLRPEPYVRRSAAGLPTIAGTEIAIRALDQLELRPPRFILAPADHPNLGKALCYLRRWPAAYEQFLTLIDSVHPCIDRQLLTDAGSLTDGLTGGSYSRSQEWWFGTLCVTVDNAAGCAEAFVRELAHQKLRALGVSQESAWRLVTNSPAELYPTPLSACVARPMTSVLHALYSLLYVVELDLRLIAAEADPAVREHLLRLLRRNVARAESGCQTVARHIRTDAAGAEFTRGLLRWAHRAIERGYLALDGHGFETRVGTLAVTRLLGCQL